MKIFRWLVVVCVSLYIGNSICIAATGAADNNVSTAGVVSNNLFSEAQTHGIEQIVHDYLIKNPHVLIDAIQELQKQSAHDEQKRIADIKESSNKHNKEIFATVASGRVVVGSDKPKVIIAEFFGYQCPICRATAPAIDTILQNNKDLQLIFIPWTFEGNADTYAAQTSLAAKRQGTAKFLAVHKGLLALSGILTKEQVDKVAQDNGLDMAKLRRDRDAKNIVDGIKANFKLAEDINLIGTPTFFVTNAQLTKTGLLPGRADVKSMQKVIDEVR